MANSSNGHQEQQRPAVILCDADRSEVSELKQLLAPLYDLVLSTAPVEALNNLMSTSFETMLLGLNNRDQSFLELIPVVKKLQPTLPIIVIADGRSLEEQRTVQRQGVFYFLPRPIARKEMLSAVANAVQKGAE